VTRRELVKQIAAALDERLLVENPPTVPGVKSVLEDLAGASVVVRLADGSAFVVDVREEVPACS
jgi:hypothetical protein